MYTAKETATRFLLRFSGAAAALILALAVSGCDGKLEEVPAPNPGDAAMVFTGEGIVPDDWDVTRATVDYPVGASFGVLGYYTASGTFNANATTGSLPNLMYNQKVEKTAGGCVYSPPKYWSAVATDKYTFFAYSPYNSPGVTLSASTVKGNPGLTLTMTDKASATSDLALAPIVPNITRAANPVQFTFTHVLCRVRFAAVFETTNLDAVRLDRITFSGIRNTGSIASLNRASYTSSPWGSTVTGNASFDVLGPGASDSRTVQYTADPAGTVLEDFAAYLLPQGGSAVQPIVYEIAYTVFPTNDDPVSYSFTYSSTSGSFLVYGKSYLYKLVFKDASVAFTAQVEDWQNVTNNTIDAHDIPFY